MNKFYLIAKVHDLEGKSVFWEAFEVSLGDRTKEKVEKTLQEFLDLSEYTEDYEVTLKVVQDPEKEK
jgi:hypothetical protein